MAKYAIAYCNPNGSTFSDTEPYIKEAGTTVKDIKNVLKILVKDGCGQLLPFEVKDELESYTWDYVNKHKVLVDQQINSKFSRRFRKDDEHMGKHINLFETKTKEELLELYKEFLEVEKKTVISDDSELGKIKTEYEKDFGANTVLMLQIELTHAISDMWYKENIKQPIDLDFNLEN